MEANNIKTSKKLNINLWEVLLLESLTFILGTFLSLSPIIWIWAMIKELPFLIAIKRKKTFALYTLFYLASLILLGVYKKEILCAGILAIVSLICIFFIHYFDKNKTDEKYQQALFTAWLPYLIIFVVEFMQQNLKSALKYLFWSHNITEGELFFHLAFCGTVLIIWFIYFTLTILFKKKRLASFFTALPLFVLGFINMVVLYLTSSPLLPSDVLIFKTAMSVIGEQKITAKLIIFATISFVLFIAYFALSNKAYKESTIRLRRRLFQGAASVFALYLIYIIIGNTNPLNFNANYRYGFIYYFIQETHSNFPVPENFEHIDINVLPEKASENIKKEPNVIIVMSEAFSDLQNTYDCKTSEDAIPYYHSLQKKYPNGIAYSSVFGNNTVSSEFECLTGISTGFTTKGSNVYQKYLTEDFYSMGQYFKNFGYETAIFHPNKKHNYNRYNAYQEMNYDKFVFLEDMPKDTEKVRTFVSDKANFDTVIDLVEETTEPLFLMNITMQNHGSYEKEFEISPYITLDNEKKYADVENYLSLLKKSDEELKNFFHQLEKNKEPTVVLLFGDHQPMVTSDFYSEQLGTPFSELSLEQKASTYQVPYMIWSNYDTKVSFEAPKETSLNYLSLILSDYMGNPDTEWFSLLRDVRKEYPVITENFVIDKTGKIKSMEAMKEQLANNKKEEANSLSLLQKYQFACYSFFDSDK